VAEGVETVDQLQALNALGCNYAQGFYFSKPLSGDRTHALMRERDDLKRAFSRLQTTDQNLSDLTSPEATVSGSPGPQDTNSERAEVTIQS
jgi:predicted signal transduction protein with EAL and GGDEF domain